MAPANTHRAWLRLEPLFLHKTLGPAIEHSKEESLSRQKPLSVGIRSLPTSPRQQARPHFSSQRPGLLIMHDLTLPTQYGLHPAASAMCRCRLLHTFPTCVQGEGEADLSGRILPRKAFLGRGLPPLRGRVPPPNTHRKGVIAEPLALYDSLRPALEQHREDFHM